MSMHTLAELQKHCSFAIALEAGINVGLNAPKSGTGKILAWITAPCLTSALMSVFERDDLYVQPGLSPTILPTIWMGTLAIDVTYAEAIVLQKFIDGLRTAEQPTTMQAQP